MAKVPVINLRKGHAVNYNNDVCVVVSMEHKCPPRMASYVQMSIRSISTKKVYNLRLTSNESLEGVNLAREEYEFSYIDGMGYHFMIIASDFTEGQILTGKVVSIKDFGAFLEFAPGKEGLVHISKLAKQRVEKVEDVVSLGDVVKVVCMGKDKMGRVSFSIKDVPADAK